MGMQTGVSQGMVSPEVLLMQQSGMQSPRLPFPQAGPGRVMQGPLAYLEKTTSNIGKQIQKPKTCFTFYGSMAVLPMW